MTLSIRNLTVAIGEHRLLADISLAVAAGELVAVIGPNGAGKTSLIHAAVGDLPAQQGQVAFAGRALADWPGRERACGMALLPQFSTLGFPFTVREVVLLGRGPHRSGAKVDDRIADAACEATDIEHLRTRRYTHLSGGEKQRVQLARVLAQIWRAEDAPDRLLLLDEPVAALDIGHQQVVMEQVRRFADQGVAVVMVQHDISLAARYADRLLALREGQAVAEGEPSAVVTRQTMHRLFDTDTRVIPHPDTGTPVVLHG